MRNDFTIFILSYKRANKLITYKTLRNSGYTGEINIICSSDDPTIDRYKELYENVIIFNKEDYKKYDLEDNFLNDNVVVYARNAVVDIAKNLNKHYYLVLDDDYDSFNFRFNDKLEYQNRVIRKNLDNVFDIIIDYFKTIPALCIALSQGGDFIGGSESGQADNIQIKRKIMNTFFCSVNRPFRFIGRINEDVNTYVRLGNIGKLVFQINQLSINQKTTQLNSGGLTEFYLDTGTYIKSFYTILSSPSCVKINLMGNKHKRLHHSVNWNLTCPKIISEKYKNNYPDY